MVIGRSIGLASADHFQSQVRPYVSKVRSQVGYLITEILFGSQE